MKVVRKLARYAEANELKSGKKASQISRSVITLSLKSETKLVLPRKESLNNKEHEVNSRLINLCAKRDINFLD